MHKRAAAMFYIVVWTQEGRIWPGFIHEQEFDYLSSFNLNTVIVWGDIWCFTISLHNSSVLHNFLQNSNDIDHLGWYLKWYQNVHSEIKIKIKKEV